ncbi:MAG TPA: CorA family divalent cation transporter [Pyrinomonadaceae bacterium]
MEDGPSVNIKAYLYDATGSDEVIELTEFDAATLDESKLLWVTVLKRDADLIERAAAQVGIEHPPFKLILEGSPHPMLVKFDEFFHFSVNSVMLHLDESPLKFPIDFLVGRNFVVTIHDDEVDFFVDLRKRERGESVFGQLSSESFIATLLDLHLVSYFHGVDAIERRVDKLYGKTLKKDLAADEFIARMIELRRDVSKLRRWLIPQRELVYSFIRPDFQQITEEDTRELYKTVESHFENAVDAVDGAREAVLGAFDLYATTASQLTNIFIQRLTFLTVVMGTLGVVASLLGMNFKNEFYDNPWGFWITVAAMIIFTLAATVYARRRRWI